MFGSKCKHIPLRGASKEPRLLYVRESHYIGMGFRNHYPPRRVLITEHLCELCLANYSAIHRIDETSAAVGPEPKTIPEQQAGEL